ncbi:MAG: hypothetical protein HY962_13125 [Ignavibacteriae bacterium]|nr:hypothetical protein [Ignavibacteriota bacterium]
MKWLLLCITVLGLQCETPYDPAQPGTHDRGEYTIAAVYDSIRSAPSGGGLFVCRMSPGFGFGGSVRLSLEADASLGATLTKTLLGAKDSVFEVLVHPRAGLAEDAYPLTVVAEHGGVRRRLTLRVRVIEWHAPDPAVADSVRARFLSWFADHHPEYLPAFVPSMGTWNTYPQILIVEHYTLLTPVYEVRVCSHVMVPPYDWAKICIRPRTSSLPTFAAFCDTNGEVTALNPCEYPRLLGY